MKHQVWETYFHFFYVGTLNFFFRCVFYREKYEYRMINQMLNRLMQQEWHSTVKIIHLSTPNFDTSLFRQQVAYAMISFFSLLIFCHSWALKFCHVSSKFSTSWCSHQSQLLTDYFKFLHANWLSQLTFYAANCFEKFFSSRLSCHFQTF